MPESVQLTIQTQLWELIPTVIYFVVGLLLFGLSILLMEKVSPFSIRKEIEEDHNVALGILMGGMMIALAIVLAAAIT